LHGRPVVTVGFVWVGEMADARRYLEDFRRIGTAAAESVDEMRYIDLQSIGDERHHHGLRRYSAGHYLTELTDAAIDAYLGRGVAMGEAAADAPMLAGGGFQGYGGAIAEVGDTETAFSHRETLVEFFAGSTWADTTEDDMRMSAARSWAAALAPYSSGTYVNVIADAGDEGVGRAYHAAQLSRLAEVKRAYDPDNVFHLNQNIRPAAPIAG
jgi:hypothetical protein